MFTIYKILQGQEHIHRFRANRQDTRAHEVQGGCPGRRTDRGMEVQAEEEGVDEGGGAQVTTPVLVRRDSAFHGS